MRKKQQFAVVGVTAFLVLAVSIGVVGFSQVQDARLRRSVPQAVFVSSPRYCFLGFERGSGISGRGVVIDEMDGHIPLWLPAGFGLQGAYDGREVDYFRLWGTDLAPQAWMEWSDGHCRSVTVSYFPGWTARPFWHLDYETADGFSNPVMGSGRGIQYTAGIPGGVVSVRTEGLSDAEAARVIRSIRL